MDLTRRNRTPDLMQTESFQCNLLNSPRALCTHITLECNRYITECIKKDQRYTRNCDNSFYNMWICGMFKLVRT